MPKVHSRIAGYYYISNFPPSKLAILKSVINSAIHVECRTIRNGVASAAEAAEAERETGGIFYNCQRAISIKIALGEMGNPQPPT